MPMTPCGTEGSYPSTRPHESQTPTPAASTDTLTHPLMAAAVITSVRVQVVDVGDRFHRVTVKSYGWRAGILRSLPSQPGEELWPSALTDHGARRRERGDGQAAGQAAMR